MLVQDTGTERIIGFPDMRNDSWYAALTRAVASTADLLQAAQMLAVVAWRLAKGERLLHALPTN